MTCDSDSEIICIFTSIYYYSAEKYLKMCRLCKLKKAKIGMNGISSGPFIPRYDL